MPWPAQLAYYNAASTVSITQKTDHVTAAMPSVLGSHCDGRGSQTCSRLMEHELLMPYRGSAVRLAPAIGKLACPAASAGFACVHRIEGVDLQW